MPDIATNSPVRSLATVRPGELVVISCILFDGVRAACARLGLGAGSVVRAVGATATHVRVLAANGREALLDARWAHFVQVTEADAVAA